MNNRKISFQKNIEALLFFLLLINLAGCSIKFSTPDIGSSFKKAMDNEQNKTINFWENNKSEQQKKQTENLLQKGITEEARKKIDKWIKDNKLNSYGDEMNMMYAGGTPLFNEATGEITDRYVYILNHHPELVQKLKLESGN